MLPREFSVSRSRSALFRYDTNISNKALDATICCPSGVPCGLGQQNMSRQVTGDLSSMVGLFPVLCEASVGYRPAGCTDGNCSGDKKMLEKRKVVVSYFFQYYK